MLTLCAARHTPPLRRAPRALKPLALLALAALLGACSANEATVGEALRPAPGKGIVVLSVTRTGWRDFDLMLDLKGPGNTLARPILVYARSRSRDWTGGADESVTAPDAPEGRLVALELAPGTYRIDGWSGRSFSGGAWDEGYEVAGQGLGIQFTVRPGAVDYAGNVNLALPARLNYNANLMPSTYRLEAGPKPERDLAVLRSKYPGTPADAVRSDPLQASHAGVPLRYYVYNYRAGSNPEMN
jgi:hypothetical protein